MYVVIYTLYWCSAVELITWNSSQIVNGAIANSAEIYDNIWTSYFPHGLFYAAIKLMSAVSNINDTSGNKLSPSVEF